MNIINILKDVVISYSFIQLVNGRDNSTYIGTVAGGGHLTDQLLRAKDLPIGAGEVRQHGGVAVVVVAAVEGVGDFSLRGTVHLAGVAEVVTDGGIVRAEPRLVVEERNVVRTL